MAGVPTVRFDVRNLDQWGRLIKSWATGLDYVSKPSGPQPPRDYWVNKSWGEPGGPAKTTTLDTDPDDRRKPWCLPEFQAVPVAGAAGASLPFAVSMTADDFKARLVDADVRIKDMPKGYRHVIVVQGDDKTMVVRLPPKDILQGSEDDLLLSGTEYPLRPFYDALYPCEAKYPSEWPDIMKLHANRIGEYTLNNCA